MYQIKNIGILHYQTGNTDGVSLEIAKWQSVLEKMGYSVHICAGDLGSGGGFEIPELYHHLDEIKQIDRNAFSVLSDFDPGALVNTIEVVSQRLEEQLQTFIKTKQIELLIINNIWSVGLNLPAALAVERVRRNFDLQAIGHHHDFYWERRGGIFPTCQPVDRMLGDFFPPSDLSNKHVVINSLAQKALADRKGLQSQVILNVFDFDAPAWTVDSYNSDLRERIGLKDGDILILQATRVIPRKGIELAIDFVKMMNSPDRRSKLMRSGLYHGKAFTEDSRIVLVLTGYTKDDVSGNYLRLLLDKARKEGVELLHIEDMIAHSRCSRQGEKIYSFWDAYAVADLVSYPSLWEGWGNQLLEAFQARLPVILFEYPVFLNDIKHKGFDVISLGSDIDDYDNDHLAEISSNKLQNAAEAAVVVLSDRERREEIVAHNHQICQRNYSLDVLQSILADFLDRL